MYAKFFPPVHIVMSEFQTIYNLFDINIYHVCDVNMLSSAVGSEALILEVFSRTFDNPDIEYIIKYHNCTNPISTTNIILD